VLCGWPSTVWQMFMMHACVRAGMVDWHDAQFMLLLPLLMIVECLNKISNGGAKPECQLARMPTYICRSRVWLAGWLKSVPQSSHLGPFSSVWKHVVLNSPAVEVNHPAEFQQAPIQPESSQ